MEEDLIKITPNKEKAKSILKMVETTLEMVKQIDMAKFSSNVTKEYYDVIRELMTVVLLLDGYKTHGEGAHKALIEYLKSNYKEFNEYEISMIDNLRITRNKISYDGFFVQKDYIKRKLKDIGAVIDKLKEIIKGKFMKTCYKCNADVKISKCVKEGVELNCLKCPKCGEEYFTSSELMRFDVLRQKKNGP